MKKQKGNAVVLGLGFRELQGGGRIPGGQGLCG
jgi:hypothetical protein